MTTYLVERYLPGRDRAWLEGALAHLPRNDADVSYLGSLYVPSDESCFCRFSAPDAESVARVNVLAGVPFARVVAAVDLSNRKGVTMRFLALIAVLAVAASIAAASAQTKTRSGHDGKPSAGLELTYTKWVAPYPTMVGFVGGDIVGKFSGAILERTVYPTSIHLTAIYIVIGPDPAHSFTAHVEGTEDLTTQPAHAVLEGRVVDGMLKHGRVHVEFDVISCTQAPSGTCFQGTISVKQGSHDD